MFEENYPEGLKRVLIIKGSNTVCICYDLTELRNELVISYFF